MRYFVNEPTDSRCKNSIILEYTRKDILDLYWIHWKNSMESKYGVGHCYITEDNCIEDWLVSQCGWVEKEKETQ